MRKRRTREHVIADLSVNHVERHALLCGYTGERKRHDYGIDLEIETYNAHGEVDNGFISVQLKATERLTVRSAAMSFSFRVERADLRRWLDEPMPVLLVVYDYAADAAYWIYVQSYFEQQAGFDPSRGPATVTIRVPVSQCVDAASMREFARFRDRILAQVKGWVQHHE